MSDYPSFADALTRFRAFATSQGAPGELMFLEPEDVVVLSGQFATLRRPSQPERSERARLRYEAAVERRLGVEIAGAISCENRLGCYVYAPATNKESIERLMPDGLKLSLLKPLVKGVSGGPLVWALVRWRQRRHPESLEWKASLFGGGSPEA